MTFSIAIPAAGTQPRGNLTAELMLSELQKAHDDLMAALEEMDTATRGPVADRNLFSNARWRLSQASLKRRNLWGKVFQHLLSRVEHRDISTLKALQTADVEMLRHSATHVGKWTTVTIEADWRGYCEASRAIRWKMKSSIGAEKRILYPLLKQDAIGGER